MSDRFEILVQLVNERHSSRDVQLHDLCEEQRMLGKITVSKNSLSPDSDMLSRCLTIALSELP